MTSAGTNSYSYDANGAAVDRAEAGASYTHAYDLEGRQTSVSISGTATDFVYNGDGELVAKQIGSVDVAHYAAANLFEEDPSTGAVRKYYRLGSILIAMRDMDLHFLGHDHLGTTTLQEDADGAFEAAQMRAPYGTGFYGSGSLATDLQYTGQRSLEATLGSVADYGARTYSPALARFLSPDPITGAAKPQGLDPYAYVRANPLRLVDPSGLFARDSEIASGGDCDAVCVGAIAVVAVHPDGAGSDNASAGPEIRNFLGDAVSKLLDAPRQIQEDLNSSQPVRENYARVEIGLGFIAAGALATAAAPEVITGAVGRVAAETSGLLAAARDRVVPAVQEFLGRDGPVFGRDGGIVNNNPLLRVGWGWKGTETAGREVFRLVIGNKNLVILGRSIHWHLDFFHD